MSPPNNPNLISPSSILSFVPPPLPLDAIYTSCYCEENIYLLAETFARIAQRDKAAFPWDVYVVFISNSDKMVALWCQKARQDVVVWDYHVILVLRPRRRSLAEPLVDLDMYENAWPSDLVSWVYDFDSRLPAPVPATSYVTNTFPYAPPTKLMELNKQFESCFRVVEANVFLDHFASDRSHMIRGRDDGGNPLWSSPPPTYAPLCGPIAKGNGTTMNLFDTFVSMEVREVKEAGSSPAEGAVAGEVLDIESFKFWLSCSDRNTVIEDV